MKRMKKGFTIVELVIVIAVVAVLTAVLVPTFVNLSKKAKDTNDKTIVKNANIQLAARQGLEGRNRSMLEAVKDVDDIGYHMSSIPTANRNKIVWDSVSDRFVLLDKDNAVLLSDGAVAEHSKLFLPVSNLEERGDFAVYAKSDFGGSTTSITFTSPISFDAGDKEGITEISYGFTSVGSVLCGTNSKDTTLTVNTPNADFDHAGLCGSIIIEAVASDTFRDHGKVGYVQVDSGHYVADAGADVKTLYASSDAAKIDKENGGKIGAAYGKDSTVTNSGHNVDLITDSGKTAEQVQSEGIDALDNDINPPEPVAERIAITNANYATVLGANPNNSLYKLGETLELPSTWYIRLESLSVDTIDIDLDGYKITAASDFHGDLIDFQTGTLKLSNGTVEFNNTADEYETIYAIVGGNFTLDLSYVNFTGSNNFRAGVYAGAATIKCLDSNFNGGWISASRSTVTFDCVGEFKVAGFMEWMPSLNPTVTTTSDYEVKSVGSYTDIDGMEGYKTYTIGRKS